MQVVTRLHDALMRCVAVFFDGWPIDACSWPVVFIDPYPSRAQITKNWYATTAQNMQMIQFR